MKKTQHTSFHHTPKKTSVDSDHILQSLLSDMSEGIVILNHEGVVEKWNPAIERITGIPADRVVGCLIWDILPELFPESEHNDQKLTQMKSQVERYLSTSEQPPAMEVQLKSRTGSVHWIEKKLTIIGSNSDKKLFLLIRDITERKSAEQHISEHNKRLQILNGIIMTCNQADASEDLFHRILSYITDLMNFDCGCFYLVDENQQQAAAQRHIGDSHNCVPNLDFFDVHHPLFGSVLEHQKAQFWDELPCDDRNKTRRPMSLTSIPLSDKGQLVGIIHLGYNKQHSFTEWEKSILIAIGQALGIMVKKMTATENFKHAEEALRKSEQRYRTVVENANDAIYIIEGRHFTYVNKRFVEIFEYTSDEICSNDVTPFLIVAPESHNFIEARFNSRQSGESIPSHYEFKAITKSKKIIDVEVNTVNLGKSGNLQVMGILRDITEKKLLEEQLRHAQKLEAIGQLAGGIAHDYNNLLTAIIGNLELLGFDLQHDSLKMELLKDAKQAADRAARLTNQLLAFSQKNKPLFKSLNINTVVTEVINLLAETIDRRISIQLKLNQNLHSINGDPFILHQIILNICLNSRDAIMIRLEEEGGHQRSDKPDEYFIEIKTYNIEIDETHVKTNPQAKPGSYVSLSIRDNGIGMTRKVQERIFEPFFTTKEIGKGTGLGLSSVYGFVELHEAWIEVQSKFGSGTTFRIFFPKMITKIVPLEKIQPSDNTIPATQTVLIVDDELVIRNLGKRLLERNGYQVMVAKDGLEALDIFKNNMQSIDLIILDLTMPKLSGKEVLVNIKKINSDAKVILTSGFSGTENENDLRNLGATDFIPKPYQFPDLLEKIKRALAS